MHRLWLVLLIVAPTVVGDTLVLKSGLRLYGKVTEDGKDKFAVTLDGKTHRVGRTSVAKVIPGESAVEEYSRRATEAKDAAGWYRLALWAKDQKMARAERAFAKVLEYDLDHRAARRELGYEKIDGDWVSGADAKRSKGFVLCGGVWVLPQEADKLMKSGLIDQAKVTDEHRSRADEIVRGLLDDDAEVRKAAQGLVTEVPDAALLRPMRRVLYAEQPEMRVFAVKQFGRIGDRTALPWLIQASMYDAQEKVRNAAFRSIKGFKDADVIYPYGRALFSKNPKASVMAADALALLGDNRGVDLVLRRISIGIGEAGRANISVGKQNSYIQDFDVEIAQAAAIGDPIVSTIRDGIILDYKILGGHGERWVVMQRNSYANALKTLTGRDYGEDWAAYRRYAKENDLPRVRLK
ncbi:MAG: HEAT repeat domain-containing protein [Planctomycetota bacterium]|jgi:hypothetical protein